MIRARLMQLLSERPGFSLAITDDMQLARHLDLSGIQRIALAYRIEQAFGIELTDSDYDRIVVNKECTVADLLAAVTEHLKEPA